jgi:hypothetical protein
MPTNLWPRIRTFAAAAAASAVGCAAVLPATALANEPTPDATPTFVAAATADAALDVAASPAPSCGLPQPVFGAWGDTALYMPTANGTLEGAGGWRLAGGAMRVEGNEPFFVSSADDRWSLALPADSSATNSVRCARNAYPLLRFFARNSGSADSLLRVEVTYTDGFGVEQVLEVEKLAAGEEWAPTEPLPFLDPSLPLDLQTSDVSFTFTPLGDGGNWQIDDVFIDPYKQK